MNLLENYLNYLYTDNRSQAKEWRGANIPYGDDSNRPNLIRKCFTLEGNRQKINCLRKLRDQVAMNPFYQARLDRFIDAITDIYEPTNKQGTIPGNEFKETAVGEDLKESRLSEKEWESEGTWEDHIDMEELEKLIGMKNIKQKDLDQARHTIQPILIKLMKNAGGDYKGRKDMKNSSSGDFSGMDWLEKQLPKDWKERAKKYIEKVSRKHD